VAAESTRAGWNLILIGEIDVLQKLYHRAVIPDVNSPPDHRFEAAG
jgi:hypothetical protein